MGDGGWLYVGSSAWGLEDLGTSEGGGELGKGSWDRTPRAHTAVGLALEDSPGGKLIQGWTDAWSWRVHFGGHEQRVCVYTSTRGTRDDHVGSGEVRAWALGAGGTVTLVRTALLNVSLPVTCWCDWFWC